MNKVECKVCKKRFTKVWSGKYKKGAITKEKLYVDNKGRLWFGRRCYSCYYENNLMYQRALRRSKPRAKPKKEAPLGPEVKLDPLTHRKCRECGKRLPASRYFAHYECAEKVNSSEGTGFYTTEDWGYGVGLCLSESLTFRISEMNLLGAT